MEMLADLYRRINGTMKAAGYGKLPRPGVGSTSTALRHYVLALQPVMEQLDGIAAKARSVMDVEVRQALSNAVSKIFVVVKVYEPEFPSEYILGAIPTVEDEQAFGVEVQEMADRYAAAFGHGDEGEDEGEVDDEEPGSP